MFEVIELGGLKTVSTSIPCNHVYLVDVSGSMYNDLGSIRQNLKNIISVVAKEQDTFSVIYFSGKGQSGVIFENVKVSDVSSISLMHKAIDRYIQPIGLTGFVDPMILAMDLNLNTDNLNNFVMMTDGYDNTSGFVDIIETAKKLKIKFNSICFIEYGFYADRELLRALAEATNGSYIFADNIEKYEKAVQDAFDINRVDNIKVKVNKKAKHAIYILDKQIKIVDVVDGEVSVPESVTKVHSIVPDSVLNKQRSDEHLYLILHYAVQTSNSKLVFDCLEALGDVYLYNLYQNSFTKQELSEFEEEVKQAAINPDARFIKGKDLSIVPDKKAKTVIDLLQKISECNADLVVDSPHFSYSRTGRKREYENELPRFIPKPGELASFGNLVFNTSRPNISVNTQIKGTVELPENEFNLAYVSSKIFRNYTIIKDGILNMNILPVSISTTIMKSGAFDEYPHTILDQNPDNTYVLFDLTKVPVINRNMVESVDIQNMAKLISDYEIIKANLKVINHETKDQGDKTELLKEAYGLKEAEWLSSIGVRDYGFSKVGGKTVEAEDQYESIQVEYKIKGLSSLPSLAAVSKKIKEDKKLNLGDSLINESMDLFVGKKDLSNIKKKHNIEKKIIESAIAREVYALILGRQWYNDSDEYKGHININNQVAEFTINKVRKMIAI